MIHPDAYIHERALVDETVSIGAGSKVWQFASVTRGTVLGEGCTVAPFALLDGARFGDRCIVSMHAALGVGFELGDDVFVGPSVTFANDAWPRTHKTGWDAQALRDGGVCVRVGNGASIGANSVILPGVVIGERAMIAAGSVVSRDVPADHLFKRSGDLTPIIGEPRRMRLV